MGAQATLPGTTRVIGTFDCGHGRTHQIPSGEVTVFKQGSGFSATCTCGNGPIESDEPPLLGPHTVLLGGTNLDPEMWLGLDEETDGWFPNTNPDCDPLDADKTVRKKREEYRRNMMEAVGRI